MQRVFRYLLAVIFLLLTAASVPALSVSVQIIQHEDGRRSIRGASYVFEDAVMDYCFERGIIVANVPAAAGGEDDRMIQTLAMNEAMAGGLEYYAAVSLMFNTAFSTNPDAVRLSNIDSVEWQIYRLSDASVCGGGKIRVSGVLPEDDTEEGFTILARQVASRICAELK